MNHSDHNNPLYVGLALIIGLYVGLTLLSVIWLVLMLARYIITECEQWAILIALAFTGMSGAAAWGVYRWIKVRNESPLMGSFHTDSDWFSGIETPGLGTHQPLPPVDWGIPRMTPAIINDIRGVVAIEAESMRFAHPTLYVTESLWAYIIEGGWYNTYTNNTAIYLFGCQVQLSDQPHLFRDKPFVLDEMGKYPVVGRGT